MSSSAIPCLRADGWISTRDSYYKTSNRLADDARHQTDCQIQELEPGHM
jgi:hypothetical protein